MRKSGRLRLGPASAYSRRSTAAARKPLMDDSAQKPFMPADAFGRSLSGFGVNILVSDVAATLAFLQERSEEHTSELQSLMRISYAVFCLKKNKLTYIIPTTQLKQKQRRYTNNTKKHIQSRR